MTIDGFEHALAKGLGLSEEAVKSAFETVLRANMTVDPAEAEESDISLQRIAAYLEGKLSETDRAGIHARMCTSPAFFHEVMALADYLEDTEAASSVSPGDMAVLTARLKAFVRNEGGKSIAIPEPDLLATLRRLPALQAKLDALLNGCTVFFMGKAVEAPALAAAADRRDTDLRKFHGGQLSIAPSPTGDGIMIVFVLETTAPGFIVVRGADGIPVRQDLPPPLDSGNRLIIKKLKTEEDRLFVQLLRDPQSKISFLENRSGD